MGQTAPPRGEGRATRAKPAATALEPRKLHSVADVRSFFIRNPTPIYFVSATSFNLMSMDEWVQRFRFINYIDCFDGRHPHVLVPSERPHATFESLEEIVNYLLEHPEVEAYVRQRGEGGKAAFLFFDEETEALCERLGLTICFPPAKLRDEIDNKINATRIANRAGVRSVPNVLVKNVDSYEALRRKAARLGDDLVVQTAFGDSGHTTFFICDEADWRRHADEIRGQGEIKVMRRIVPRQAAIEACVTRAGTIVGPLMTELVGFDELTPYRGGWCGNEVYAGAFSKKVRDHARRKTVALGAELWAMGYRGYFEVDYLIDAATDRVYLGEINPRVTGASSMTNLSAFAHAEAPLFLFHLLEFFDVDFELDVDEINARWADPSHIDSWSQMVIKHTADDLRSVTAAPASGVWELDEGTGGVHFLRPQIHRRTVDRHNQGFFLRIAREGSCLYEGADVGILLTPGRLMDDDGALTPRALAWISGVRGELRSEPTSEPGSADPLAAPGFKLL